MSLFSFFKREKPEQQNYEWENGPSILTFLQSWNGEDDLPDEKPATPNQIRFAPGALDGIMSHHFGEEEGGKREHRVAKFLDILTLAVKRADDSHRSALYSFFDDDEVLAFADDLVEAIISQHKFAPEELRSLARWLLEKAAHCGRFKLAIILLGLCGDENDLEQLKLAAKHPEFALFASVALINLAADPTQALWEVAQAAKGWDKIQIVERLAPQATERPEIQDWLLRSGFQNGIMYEYLAYLCAVHGNLIGRLREPYAIDEELLDSIGDLFNALLNGGPAQDLNDYEDGIEATERLIGLWETRCDSLERLTHVIAIRRELHYIRENMERFESQGWTHEIVEDCTICVDEIINRPQWLELVQDDSQTYQQVGLRWQISKVLGVDLWERMFACLLENSYDTWLYQELLATDDSNRKQRVVDFAEENLPLESMASGPSDSLGFGMEFRQHSALDTLIGTMNADFWSEKLVLAALRSPVTRNRHSVLYALARIPRQQWGKTVETRFKQSWEEEIDEKIKRHFADVDANRTFEWNLPDNEL